MPTKTSLDSATRIMAALKQDKKIHATKTTEPYSCAQAIECLASQLDIEFPIAAKRKRVNGRDLIFDALAEISGLDTKGITRGASGGIIAAKRDILEATPDCTPDEVRRRAELYRKKYRGAVLTATALASHWPEFGNGNDADRTRGAKRDVYVEPPNWQISHKARSALNASQETWHLVCARGWFDLTVDLRADILRAMD